MVLGSVLLLSRVLCLMIGSGGISFGCTRTYQLYPTKALVAGQVADYEFLAPVDHVIWSNATHGHIEARVRLLPDAAYEGRESFTLQLRHHSTLYPDSVLEGPTKVRVVIADGAPGSPRFAKAAYNVSESDEEAFVALFREGGSTGDSPMRTAPSML